MVDIPCRLGEKADGGEMDKTGQLSQYNHYPRGEILAENNTRERDRLGAKDVPRARFALLGEEVHCQGGTEQQKQPWRKPKQSVCLGVAGVDDIPLPGHYPKHQTDSEQIQRDGYVSYRSREIICEFLAKQKTE